MLPTNSEVLSQNALIGLEVQRSISYKEKKMIPLTLLAAIKMEKKKGLLAKRAAVKRPSVLIPAVEQILGVKPEPNGKNSIYYYYLSLIFQAFKPKDLSS